jgi:hypothetical protein
MEQQRNSALLLYNSSTSSVLLARASTVTVSNRERM